MLGHRLTTRLGLLKPNVSRNQDMELIREKITHDLRTKGREFEKGEEIWLRSRDGKEGLIICRNGVLSYLVKVADQQVCKHADQLKRRVGDK